MKPIQTVFKGYRFRSRLEARWAVFLENLGAEWVYEREGFDLKGSWYLPDFWISDWDAWIEIKASEPDDREYQKCLELARQSGKMVLLVYGEPWVEDDSNKYDMIMFGADPLASHDDQSDPSQPIEIGDCSSGWEFATGRRCSEEIWLVSDDGCAFTIKPVPHDREEKYPLAGSASSKILAACKAARGARFEHGESGGV